MILVTEKLNLKTNAESDIFIKPEDLTYLMENPQELALFLEQWGKPFIEVGILADYEDKGEILEIREINLPDIKDNSTTSGGYSHAISF